MLSEMHYAYSKDSLFAKYGNPTKMIVNQSNNLNIKRKMRFYESAKKFLFMGNTIDFKDIMGCNIVDDFQFIPGRTHRLSREFYL